MSATHSTPTPSAAKPAKPAKPSEDFPLFPHATGQWAKKVDGKMHYFGVWADPGAALARYQDFLASRPAGPQAVAGCAVKQLANAYLNAKQALVSTGELSPRTFADLKRACDLVVSALGKSREVASLRPEDFVGIRRLMERTWGPVRLGVFVQKVRSIFKYAYDAGLVDRPVRFGPGFERPSRKVLRLHRAKQWPKLFTADEIRRLIAAARRRFRAMTLLGINCGFGNADCANLPLAALDLEGGWVNYPRPKTGMPRRCALWPETVAALREALARRKPPQDARHGGLVFLTGTGSSYAAVPSTLSRGFTRLLHRLGINGRKGLGFYTLRHTFRTVADEAKDQPAVDFIMGHEVPHMSSVYRETISDDRLRVVAEHVRSWLFGG
jgi:integrase